MNKYNQIEISDIATEHIDFEKLDIKRFSSKDVFAELDKAFDKLCDSRIGYKTIKSDCLGTLIATDLYGDTLIYADTKLEDLYSLESNYSFKCVIFEDDLPPNMLMIRPCRRGDFRGEAKYLPKNSIHLTQTVFFNGKTKTEELPICEATSDTGFTYKCPIINKSYLSSPNLKDIQNCLNIAYKNTRISICLAWEDYFHWKIRVKMPEWQKSIELWINPANIKEVFKLRDIPDGEQRRKALKHIVSAHTRTIANGEKIEIMRYLRGREKFSQNGYEITIIPSLDDAKSLGKKI